LFGTIFSFLKDDILVVYAYNPSYLGDWDQEECGLKPSQAKIWRDPILTKKLGVVVHACGSV
jgi:hypothetical protein